MSTLQKDCIFYAPDQNFSRLISLEYVVFWQKDFTGFLNLSVLTKCLMPGRFWVGYPNNLHVSYKKWLLNIG